MKIIFLIVIIVITLWKIPLNLKIHFIIWKYNFIAQMTDWINTQDTKVRRQTYDSFHVDFGFVFGDGDESWENWVQDETWVTEWDWMIWSYWNSSIYMRISSDLLTTYYTQAKMSNTKTENTGVAHFHLILFRFLLL